MAEEANETVGRTYGFGWNAQRQLDIYGETAKKPTSIPYLQDLRIRFVSAGLAHSAALSDTGELYTFGKPTYGRLGLGKVNDQYGKVALPKRAVAVSCGAMHTVVVTSAHEVLSFGHNAHGELGLGHTEDVYEPIAIEPLRNNRVCLVACGGAHTLFATESGAIFATGSNEHFQLGSPSVEGFATSPIRIELPRTPGSTSALVSSLAAGSAHSAAAIGGRLLTWGSNSKGQCSTGTFEDVRSPQLIVAGPLQDQNIIQVSCGLEHTAVISDTGALFTFGSDEFSQCGHGAVSQLDAIAKGASASSGPGRGPCVNAPRQVKEALLKKAVVEVSCGSYHTMALTDHGELYVWGLNDYSQLGNNTTSSLASPYHLRGVLSDAKISSLACGGRHSLVACSPLPLIKVTPSTFTEDFQAAIANPLLSDVELVAAAAVDEEAAHHQTQHIHAHRLPLEQCAFFRNNEAVPHDVRLDTIGVPTLRLILGYLYTGCLSIPCNTVRLLLPRPLSQPPLTQEESNRIQWRSSLNCLRQQNIWGSKFLLTQ